MRDLAIFGPQDTGRLLYSFLSLLKDSGSSIPRRTPRVASPCHTDARSPVQKDSGEQVSGSCISYLIPKMQTSFRSSREFCCMPAGSAFEVLAHDRPVKRHFCKEALNPTWDGWKNCCVTSPCRKLHGQLKSSGVSKRALYISDAGGGVSGANFRSKFQGRGQGSFRRMWGEFLTHTMEHFRRIIESWFKISNLGFGFRV